jgi:hypothetical protein
MIHKKKYKVSFIFLNKSLFSSLSPSPSLFLPFSPLTPSLSLCLSVISAVPHKFLAEIYSEKFSLQHIIVAEKSMR